MPKFSLGTICITPNALRNLVAEDITASMRRHWNGDWGDVDEEDRKANEEALLGGSRLFSVYHGRDGTKYWIITEADRSVTTVLLPEDY